MGFIWKFLVVVLMAAVAHRITKLVIFSGFYKPLFNHAPGPCHLVRGVVNGSEDMVTLTTGVTLISSGLDVPLLAERMKGQILNFDFNKPAAGAREVTIEGDLDRETFNPFGLSAYEDRQKGKVTVFIINRPGFRFRGDYEEASVEVFDFKQEKNTLTHQKTIKHSNIYTPNNIVAVTAGTFYLTNDGYSDWLPTRLMEMLLVLPIGSVVYYDGEDVRQVASSLVLPNGVALSHTRRYLYVSLFMGQCVDIYQIQQDASLVFVKSIHLATAVDNMTVDPDTGDIWAGCVFNLLVAASQEGRAKGSAQVLRISFDKDLNAEIREVLMDDGGLLRGSSVASLYKRHLLVGTAMGKMLFCQVKAF